MADDFGMEFSDQIKGMISDVEGALDSIRRREGDLGIRLVKSELVIEYQIRRSEKAELKGRLFGFIPYGAGASSSSNEKHKLSIFLTRKQSTGTLASESEKKIADAVLGAAKSIKEMKAQENFSYTVDSFCLLFKLELLESGELQLLFGGAKESAAVQELSLTFEFQ